MTDIKHHVVKGEVMWANVIYPKNNYNGEPEYSIKVKTDIEPLYELGLNKKTKQDEDGYIKFKRNPINKNGDASPPSIVDSQLIPWDFKVGIGNGSFCAVRLAMIPYDQFGGGIAFRIDGIQVIKHVPYELKDPTEGFDKVDEGELPF